MTEDRICPYCGAPYETDIARRLGKILGRILMAAVILGALAGLFISFRYGHILNYYRKSKELPVQTIEYYEKSEEELLALDMDAFWRQPGIWQIEYPDLTDQQRQAMEKAARKLSFGGKSRTELVNDLMEEQMTREQAEEAIDLCQVNWNTEAVEEACGYLSYCTYSPEELRTQMEREQFLPEQIDYAIENCGVDWNKQAYRAAQLLIRYGAYSREDVRYWMEQQGHAPEAASYAAENLETDWNTMAVMVAEEHLDMGKMSKAEMLQSLTEEGFTQEEAEYAVTELKLK